jgi:hypothetical protein
VWLAFPCAFFVKYNALGFRIDVIPKLVYILRIMSFSEVFNVLLLHSIASPSDIWLKKKQPGSNLVDPMFGRTHFILLWLANTGIQVRDEIATSGTCKSLYLASLND